MPSVNEASQPVNTGQPRSQSLFPEPVRTRICCENCGVAEFDYPGLGTCNCIECRSCGMMVDNEGQPPCGRCGYCRGCCGCWECPCCEEMFSRDQGDKCNSCDRCISCCDCDVCPRCNRRVRLGSGLFCEECEYCTDHCICGMDVNSEAATEIHFIRLPGRPTFWTGSKKSILKGIGPKRFISCELEIAQARKYVVPSPVKETAKLWKAGVVHDGSLGYTGFEICTAPANGDKFVEQISMFCEALQQIRYKISTSCGFHVHVDARDLGWWGIRRLALLYCKIEEALFTCLPSSRRNSSYCKRCSDAMQRYLVGTPPKKIKKQTFEMVYNMKVQGRPGESVFNEKLGRHVKPKNPDDVALRNSIASVKEYKYHDARYAAMNLHSWFFRGSVENRMAAGTGSFEKIFHWSMLWDSIVEYASAGTEKGIKELVPGIKTLLSIPPEPTANWLRERMDLFRSKRGNCIEFESDEA